MIFDYEWREQHARAGDEAVWAADELLVEAADQAELGAPSPSDDRIAVTVAALAALAQAHYAAANIRTRPAPDPEEKPEP